MNKKSAEQAKIDTRAKRSDITKRRLVEALESLLATQSINDFKVSDIAKKAGLTTGAIYPRFQGKRDLVRAACERWYDECEVRTQKLGSRLESSNVTGEEAIVLIVDNFVKMLVECTPVMRAASAFNDAPSNETLYRASGMYTKLLLEIQEHSSSDSVHVTRARFVIRTVASVVRDSYIGGLGTDKFNMSPKEFLKIEKRSINRLISYLCEMCVPYLNAGK